MAHSLKQTLRHYARVAWKGTMHAIPHPLVLDYHLVDSCNLNCASCLHYSSVAKKDSFIDIGKMEREMILLHDKTSSGKKLRQMRLLGGEPLLHPHIVDCLSLARKYFPKANLTIWTNGILLPKMGKDFYDACRKYNIDITISDYKILDTEETASKTRQEGIVCDVAENMGDRWLSKSIRLTPGIVDCFKYCDMSYECNTYRDGKVYLCPLMAHIEIFNHFFEKNIVLGEKSFVDVTKVRNYFDLQWKVRRLRPRFCYVNCNLYDAEGNLNLTVGQRTATKKDIEEFCAV